MAEKVFIDTNILIYAHDKEAGSKHLVALQCLEKIWDENRGVLSLQILQEFYVVLTQKLKEKLSRRIAKEIIEQYSFWETAHLSVKDLLSAIDLQDEYHFSFWNALVVQTALSAGCAFLLSEDFQHEQKINDLTILNPFQPLTDDIKTKLKLPL